MQSEYQYVVNSDGSGADWNSNHNMDPAVVGSAEFGKLFSTLLPGNFNNIGPEQIFSQPLVYTGDDGVQYVYVATTQNNLYKLDAKTGAIIMKRNMHVPFLTADLNGKLPPEASQSHSMMLVGFCCSG